MVNPIPVLSDYGISETRGFLPDVLPLTRLPDPYYNKWEAIADNFQALVLSKNLRPIVDALPVLSTVGLEGEAEWRRAYSLLCFMAHGYVWGDDVPSDRLPPSISVPLLEIAAHLEVPPVATYAAVCLWNFKPIFRDEPLDSIENLATLNTFTGSLDESWFYLVSVAIEARGASIVPLMLRAMQAVRDGDAALVTRCLGTFAERLDDLGALLQRMHENCDPTIFYNRIRPFLAGWKNMAEAGLPLGVRYELTDHDATAPYRQYSGGSNAQSSLIQFFDIVLGIEHRPTGEKAPSQPYSSASESEKPTQPQHNFIAEMRRYMPGPHARFLRDVAAVANVRDFVVSRPHDRPLRIAYDACLAMLRAFRDRHIAIVARYIIVPSRESRARSRSRSPTATRNAGKLNLATAGRRAAAAVAGGLPDGKVAAAAAAKKAKGTGGTALIPFLKQARDETGEPAVEEWTRRFMGRQLAAEARGADLYGSFSSSPPSPAAAPETAESRRQAAKAAGVGNWGVTEDVEVPGLAGTWTVEDEGGGICNW